MPQPQLMYGSLVSTGAAMFLDIPMGVKKFTLYNYTNYGTPAASDVVQAIWQEGMAPGTALTLAFNAGATEVDARLVTTNGVAYVDEGLQNQLEAALVGTAITAATPAVATDAGHPYQVGDIVRVTNTTGMLQIAGMDFSITAINGNDFTFGYLAAAGFAAAATALTTRRLRYDNPYKPRNRFITGISQAAQAVITLSVTHGYNVGEYVRIAVPAEFGMPEINEQRGKIVAINTTTNTITVDINSSGFTAFAFPASATVPFSFPQITFAGEDSLLVSDPFRNTLRRGLLLGTNIVGAASDVLYWSAEWGF